MSMLTIYFIRHAEKPNELWPGPGLTDEGIPDTKSLVIRGWQRAGAWAALFGTGLGQPDYLGPQVVFAAKPGDDAPTRAPVGGQTRRRCRLSRGSG